MPSSQQSPINLEDAIFADLGDRGLDIQWSGDVTGLVVKEEDGVRVQFFPDAPQTIRLDRRLYKFNSFHFHHPSEHLIGQTPFDVELHLVHRRVDDGAHFAVIAVLIELGGATACHPDVEVFLRQVAKILNPVPGQPVDPMVTVNPRVFLPEEPGKYYRYEGSLTTPEFTENVSWVVMKDPLKVSRQELRGLILEFKKTARNPQSLDRRFLLATFGPDETPTRVAQATTEPSKASPAPRGKRARKETKPKAS
jgi:carbonic anhydrase